MHHKSCRAEFFGHFARDGQAVGQRRVAVYRAHAANAKFGRVKRLDQREGVVDIAVGQTGGHVNIEPDVGLGPRRGAKK
jgi:hypothetical protein